MYENYTLADVKKSAERKLFTVFSTFAGGGGSSTGYKLAGGDVRGVLEFQQIGIDTYLENYRDTPKICEDIKNVTGSDVLELIDMKVGDLDILDGSPPCPPFSMSGSKRKGWNQTKVVYGFEQSNIEDLSFELARMVHVVRPKVFICENVKGMTMDYAHDHFQTIMDAFSDSNSPYWEHYKWKDDKKEQGWVENSKYEISWRILNAKDYGVAQGRQRVFIVGIRDDIYGKDNLSPREQFDIYGEFSSRRSIDNSTLKYIWPHPVTREVNFTLRDAIEDLIDDEDNKQEGMKIIDIMKKQKRWEHLKNMPIDVDKETGFVELATTIYNEKMKEHSRLTENDPNFNEPMHTWKHKKTGEIRHDDVSYMGKEWENLSFVRGSGWQVRRVSWDKPSHTLTERGLQTGTSAHIHPQYPRGFTPKEAMRIMSLPDDYHLEGGSDDNMDKKLARIGLMVAPRQMEHLARSVYEQVIRKYNNA